MLLRSLALAVVVAVRTAVAVSVSCIHFLSVVIAAVAIVIGRISGLVCVFVFGRSRSRLVGVRILVIAVALAIFIVVGRTPTSSSRSAIFVAVAIFVDVVRSNTTRLSGPKHQRVVLSLGGIHGSLVGYRLDAHVEDIALRFGQSRKPFQGFLCGRRTNTGFSLFLYLRQRLFEKVGEIKVWIERRSRFAFGIGRRRLFPGAHGRSRMVFAVVV